MLQFNVLCICFKNRTNQTTHSSCVSLTYIHTYTEHRVFVVRCRVQLLYVFFVLFCFYIVNLKEMPLQ